MDLATLYSLMTQVERQLGGGEGVVGIYGSVTKASMERVIQAMVAHANLSWRSTLVDIGSGLGRPLAHAATYPGVHHGIGIELDPVKHDKAVAFIARVAAGMRVAGHTRAAHNIENIVLVNQSVESRALALDGCSHAYTFWEGFNQAGKTAVGTLFASNTSLRYITVVQRAMRDPVGEMQALGFPRLVLLHSLPVTMSGSGRRFHAYLFKKPYLRLRR